MTYEWLDVNNKPFAGSKAVPGSPEWKEAQLKICSLRKNPSFKIIRQEIERGGKRIIQLRFVESHK